MSGRVTVYWFRKALRLHDSPSLVAACDHAKRNGSLLLPIFILDPWFIKSGNVCDNRILFLLESLTDLDANLRAIGSRLMVLQGSPVPILTDLFEKYKVNALFFEKDTEPYAKQRDAEVYQLCVSKNVESQPRHGHTLYNPVDFERACRGTPPVSYQGFLKIIASLGPPARPLPAPSRSDIPLIVEGIADSEYMIPTMTELGLTEVTERTPFRGGETVALERMASHIKRKSYILQFEKPKTDPTATDPPATTVLSPYLKFGCLSVRLFFSQLQEVFENKLSQARPETLAGQIYWREFFYQTGNLTSNFDKMEGNRICRQIPWSIDETFLNAWKDGQTGYPFVDAVMIQLKKWGWMHHLSRHVVACFLTRGDLWQPWTEGAAHFDKYLLDADWSINNANWMWLSCSAFFHQYHRVYSPISFGKKYDKNGKFIKTFLPVLKDMPAQYIYEPWTAPLEVQKKAKCIIGVDYPKPIVDHETTKKANLDKMSKAFAANKEYTSEKMSEGAEAKRQRLK